MFVLLWYKTMKWCSCIEWEWAINEFHSISKNQHPYVRVSELDFCLWCGSDLEDV